ncbi:hypothetical protein LCGC14_0363090 [marine sediment metagenome]|uniref:Uncharacterized protein n=1 Tax=marine sediment metagenome TaxID=412755 RepID=A0A0F9WFM6_9ZZZZ
MAAKLSINKAIGQELRRKTGTPQHVKVLKSGKEKGMTHVKYDGEQIDFFYNPKSKKKYDPDFNKFGALK